MWVFSSGRHEHCLILNAELLILGVELILKSCCLSKVFIYYCPVHRLKILFRFPDVSSMMHIFHRYQGKCVVKLLNIFSFLFPSSTRLTWTTVDWRRTVLTSENTHVHKLHRRIFQKPSAQVSCLIIQEIIKFASHSTRSCVWNCFDEA